ncbi:MAG: hypothetical protein ACR2OM_11760 [Aestuariivirgaceae bacterium]
MSTLTTKERFREETPENYRSPGTTRSTGTIGPSTMELLSLLNSMEAKLAA